MTEKAIVIKVLTNAIHERLDPKENWHGHCYVISGKRKAIEDVLDIIKKYAREKGLEIVDVRGDLEATKKLISEIFDADRKNDRYRFKNKVLIVSADDIDAIANEFLHPIYPKFVKDLHDFISRRFTRAILSGLLIIIEYEKSWQGEAFNHFYVTE